MKQQLQEKINTLPKLTPLVFVLCFGLVAIGTLAISLITQVLAIPSDVEKLVQGLTSFSIDMIFGVILISVSLLFFSKLLSISALSVAWLMAIPAYFLLLSLPRETSSLIVLVLTSAEVYLVFFMLDNSEKLTYMDSTNEAL